MKEDLMAEATKHPPLPPDRVRDKPRRLGRCMRATEYSHAVAAINAVYPDAIEIADQDRVLGESKPVRSVEAFREGADELALAAVVAQQEDFALPRGPGCVRQGFP